MQLVLLSALFYSFLTTGEAALISPGRHLSPLLVSRPSLHNLFFLLAILKPAAIYMLPFDRGVSLILLRFSEFFFEV